MEQENNNQIRQAFFKIKQDIQNLDNNLKILKQEINQINGKLDEICTQILYNLIKKPQKTSRKQLKTIKQDFDTPTPIFDTPTPIFDTPTHSSTDNLSFKALKEPYLGISNGNQGVPTNRQTDKQTNRHTPISYGNQEKMQENQKNQEKQEKSPKIILKELDNLKKGIRLKFKRLTQQEMLVFSTLYQFEEEVKQEGQESQEITYKTISKKLGLSESSIRDYIGRLIKKKIPIIKKKVGNKKIILHISEDLKTITSLNTLLKLREI